MAPPVKKASSADSFKKQKAGDSLGENNCVRAYLIAYNVCQMLGWAVIGVKILDHLKRENGDYTQLYTVVEPLLQIFQTAAVLEILHSATGWVRSNLMVTTAQVFSRVFLLWGVVWSVPEVQGSKFILCFLCAWTVTEIIRYSFYFFSLVGFVPYTLKWCRYTLFIILYPVGVTGEVMTIYEALPSVQTSNLYSLPLPNPYNIGFSFYYYLWFILASYVPVFPHLYLHMFSQRKKIISSPHPKAE